MRELNRELQPLATAEPLAILPGKKICRQNPQLILTELSATLDQHRIFPREDHRLILWNPTPLQENGNFPLHQWIFAWNHDPGPQGSSLLHTPGTFSSSNEWGFSALALFMYVCFCNTLTVQNHIYALISLLWPPLSSWPYLDRESVPEHFPTSSWKLCYLCIIGTFKSTLSREKKKRLKSKQGLW